MPPSEQQREQQSIATARERFVQDVLKSIKTEPDKSNVMARESFENLEVKEGVKLNWDQLKLAVRQFSEELFNAALKNINKEMLVREGTTNELRQLKNSVVGVIGGVSDSVKLHEAPYGKDPNQNVMDSAELVKMKEFIEGLKKVDIEEFVDMTRETQPVIKALKEQTRDPERSKIDPEAMDILGNMLLDLPISADAKKPSEFRNNSQKLMAYELVRGMKFEQKKELLYVLAEKGDEEKVQKAVFLLIEAESLSKRDVNKIFQADKQEGPGRLNVLGSEEEIKQLTNEAIKAKEAIRHKVDNYVDQMEHKRYKSFANEFLTFNNIALETVARCAALSALVNWGLKISDAVTLAPGGTKEKVVAGLKGAVTGLVDPYVIGGTAVALATSNSIYPWASDWLHSPSSTHAEHLEEHGEEKFLKEQYENHDGILQYFYENYADHPGENNDFFDSAKRNFNEGVPDPEKGGERNIGKKDFALTSEDLKDITPQQAGQWGFPNVKVAQATIIRMFNFTAKIKKIESKEKLNIYLKEKKLLG